MLSSPTEIAKTTARGSLHLFIGQTVSTATSAVGTILVVRLLTPDEYGMISIAFILPTILGLFQTWGTRPALTRFIARYRAENNGSQIRPLIRSGLTLELTTAALFSLLCYLSADWISSSVFNLPQLKHLIQVASLTVFATSTFTTTRSIFNGFERMEYTSLVAILSSILRTLTSPLLIIAGLGALGPVIGRTLGLTIAGGLGITISYRLYREIRNPPSQRWTLIPNLKRIVTYGFPLTVAGILTGTLDQFHFFLLALFTTPAHVGYYTAALGLTAIVAILTHPVATALFPAFSKINPFKQAAELKTAFTASVRYMSMGVVPAATVLIVLSSPLVEVLYTERYAQTSLLLSLYLSIFLLVGVGRLVIGNVMQATGETKTVLTMTAIVSAVGGVLGLVLIPLWGAVGLILAFLAGALAGLFYALRFLHTTFNLTIDYASSARIYLSSALAGASAFLVLSATNLSGPLALLLGAPTFLATYLLLLPALGGITEQDLTNLREILGPLRLVSWAILPLISFEELILTHIPKRTS